MIIVIWIWPPVIRFCVIPLSSGDVPPKSFKDDCPFLIITFIHYRATSVAIFFSLFFFGGGGWPFLYNWEKSVGENNETSIILKKKLSLTCLVLFP